MSNLQSGTAKADITPPVGTPLVGYVEKEREEGAKAIHDPLYAKCIVLDDGTNKIALVTTDLIGVDKEFTNSIRTMIEQHTDIKGESILISSTHTHCGPAATIQSPSLSFFLKKYDQSTLDMLDRLREVYIWKIAGAIIEANRKLRPVEAGIGSGELASGEICTNRNAPEEGPFDSELVVLRVNNVDGEVAAIVSNYSCHPTVVPYDIVEVSADFPGYGMALVEDTFPQSVGLHANGAEGDISTRWARWEQTHREAKRLGEIFGAEVVKTAHQIKTNSDVAVQVKTHKITLPIKDFPTEEEARAIYEKNKQIVEEIKSKKGSHGEFRRAYTTMLGSQFQLNYIENEIFKEDTVTTLIQTMALGELGIVAIPGEMFTQLQLDIKKRSPFKKTMVIALANDYIGYILDPVAYDNKAIYEAWATTLGKDAGTMLVDKSIEMLQSMK